MRLALLAWVAVGCAAEPPPPRAPPREAQSYSEAVQIMCDVDRLAGVDPDDVLDAEAKRSEYLLTHVKSGDGLYTLTLFRTSDTRGQLSLLEEAVTDAKVPSCPLLDVLRSATERDVPLAEPAPADQEGYAY